MREKGGEGRGEGEGCERATELAPHPVQTDTRPPRDALVLHAGMPRPSAPVVPAHGTIVMTSLANVMRRALTSSACDCTKRRSPTVGFCF